MPDVRVDTSDDLTMRWIVIYIGTHPFSDGLGQKVRCLAAALLSETKEIVGKDHAVAVDED